MRGNELAGWLRLTLTPGVGPDAARRLLAAFGLPEAVFAQPLGALRLVVSDAQANALATPPPDFDTQLAAAHTWLDGGADRRIWGLADADYPAALLRTEDPPLLLYAVGSGLADGTLSAPALAIVGSRNPTPQGCANAQAFAGSLAQAGLVVVSGMALGIDGAAHEGALDAGGRTIAVVGTGLDRVYPKRHLGLAHRITASGLVVSELPLGTPPLAHNFPRRNRIISALSQGTLVVEAALQSGSLITARLALEQGKEVFAIPGSIHAPQSRGCHALIKQGAKLVESAQDVLEELRWPGHAGIAPEFIAEPPDSTRAQGQNGLKNAVLAALGHDPASLDVLMARTGLDAAHLQGQLLELELADQVARLPGGLFQQRGRG